MTNVNYKVADNHTHLRSLIIAENIRSLKSIMAIAAMCITLASLCSCAYWAESYSLRQSETRKTDFSRLG